MNKYIEEGRISPSQYCRLKGLDSFAELQRLSKVPQRTLLDWYESRPRAFVLLVAGAVVEKQNLIINEVQEEIRP